MGKLGKSLALVVCLCLGVLLSYFGLYNRLLQSGQDTREAVFPAFTLSAGPCNCTFRLPSSYFRGNLTSSVTCSCTDKETSPPNPDIALQEPRSDAKAGKDSCNETKVAEQTEKRTVVQTIVKYEPWYAEGRTWHYPVLLPRCSMDVCFNYSRCEDTEGLLIYSYDSPSPPVRYFSRINQTKWHTSDPEKACLFFVFLDRNSPFRPHPNELPHWNSGMNHVLITFADMWRQKGPPQDSIGYASVMASDMHETIYRAGFDISIPLPGHLHMIEFETVQPFERKYLLTFRGLRYLGKSGEGVLRSYESFRAMHNGHDIIVATTCRQGTNDLTRKESPELGAHCDEDEVLYTNYTYNDLMNTTFGLVPAGRQPNSYRFVEVLSAGVIPVLIADNYVKPFDTLIQWHRCLLQFPSTEIHRIVPTVKALVREEVEKRQRYCLQVYNEFLKDDETLMRAAVESLKARFLGVFPVKESSL